MMIKRIAKIKLEDVTISPMKSKCFLHDYEFLRLKTKDIRDELEGQVMLVYFGDFSKKINIRKCPWCGEHHKEDFEEHIYRKHKKTLKMLQVLKFQQELYKEKLILLRSLKIDHTYFIYTNWFCQHCDNPLARGKGVCAIPESARNKTRSLYAMGFKAKNFPEDWIEKDNLGYIMGFDMSGRKF